MKRKYIPVIAAMSALCLFSGCGQSAPAEADFSQAAKLVVDIPTTQYFTEETVSDADIETILLAGINAPSAMNGQPWHFSVVKDASVLQQIADDMSKGMPFGGGKPPVGMMPEGKAPEGMPPMPEGEMPDAPPVPAAGGMSKAGMADAPMAIIISCKDGSQLDAGLACQNMSVTAQLLGYGTKIISSPTIALNGEKQAEYKELLGIPADQSAAAILLIGKEDLSVDTTADSYTGATERNPLTEVVTYID